MSWAMHDHCYYLNDLNLPVQWLVAVPKWYLMWPNVDYYCCCCCSMMMTMMTFYSSTSKMVMMIWILWPLMLLCSVSSKIETHKKNDTYALKSKTMQTKSKFIWKIVGRKKGQLTEFSAVKFQNQHWCQYTYICVCIFRVIAFVIKLNNMEFKWFECNRIDTFRICSTMHSA